jgi:hemolysin activation/secretion protein
MKARLWGLLAGMVVSMLASQGFAAAPSVVELAPAVDSKAGRIAQLNGVTLSKIYCVPTTVEVGAAGSDRCVVGELEAQVSAIVADYLQVPVSIEDLLLLKDRLNQLYALHGFINTGVNIPDQEIAAGVLRLDLTLGQVDRLTITSELNAGYISPRLQLTRPFNLQALQTRLKLLEQDPRVRRIDARVAPGDTLGKADLSLAVDTQPAFALGLSLANDRAPAIGANNARLRAEANNLTGWGDSLQGSVSVTRGLNAYDVRLGLPLMANDLSVALEHSRSDSSVIEEPFAAINVDSQTRSTGIVFDLPVRRTLASTLSLGLTLESRRNQTFLLGQPFSFSEGAVNGESRVTPVRLAVAYMHQGQLASLATRLSVSYGTGYRNPTEHDAVADGRFAAYVGQLQYSRLLSEHFYMTGKLLLQYTDSPLLAIEKFAVGGAGSVRGYRENQLVRDKAGLLSMEGRYRVAALPGLELLSFFDWGSGENAAGSTSAGRDTLYSVGAGVAYRGASGLGMDLFFAHGFNDFPVVERNWQDDGIHFRLSYDYRF